MVFYLFSNKVSRASTLTMLSGSITHNTLSDWQNYYRDLMSRDMVDNPVLLGGPGIVVQMDESKFAAKRKYNRGRMPPDGSWVFGAIDTVSKKVAIFQVANRTKRELTRYIEQYVAPRSVLHTDMWGGYFSLSQHPNQYVHRTVNHSENFVDPDTGVHTQMIEGFWGNAKDLIKSMHGVHSNQMAAMLDEITWRWNNKERDTFDALIGLMNRYYPCDQVDAPDITY